jgi:hypothetical protein
MLQMTKVVSKDDNQVGWHSGSAVELYFVGAWF